MALPKKTLQQIAQYLKIKETELETAINDEKEIDIEIPKLHVFTDEEITQRDTNNKLAGKREGEPIGEEKGKDLATKAIKAKLGITEPSKDPEVIAGLIQAKISGDAASKEQIILLQKDITTKDSEIATLRKSVESVKTDTELLTFLPSTRTPVLETSEHLDLVKKNLEFTTDGVKYKGEVLRNPVTKEPLDKKSAIEHFYTERKLITVNGDQQAQGRGGSNSGNSNTTNKTLGDVRKEWTAKNPGQNWGNLASQEHLQGVLKQNPDLIMEDFDDK